MQKWKKVIFFTKIAIYLPDPPLNVLSNGVNVKFLYPLYLVEIIRENAGLYINIPYLQGYGRHSSKNIVFGDGGF